MVTTKPTPSSEDGGVTRIHQVQPLGALSRADALARIAEQPTGWLVEPFVTRGTYGSLSGEKGVGKTLALEDLGVSIALGDFWLGRFACHRGRVLILTAEDSEAETWRRIDAVTVSKGHKPSVVEGRIFVHPLPVSVISTDGLAAFRAELERLAPLDLVIIDPAYKYMAGAKSSQLFDMGAVLTPLQQACQEVGAALIVGHHFNRGKDRARQDRLSGAGILEWSRFVITIDAGPAIERGGPVVAEFEVSGNSVPGEMFTVRRRVRRITDEADAALEYEVEVIAAGKEAEAEKYAKSIDRVYAVLPERWGDVGGLTVDQVFDAVKNDGHKTPLKKDTIRKALNTASKALVGSGPSADGPAKLWWRK